MSKIPKSHPRYASLVARERVVQALEDGYLATQGLIAHGRGEAFDYLLGEQTTPPAERATRAGAAALVSADRPVLSVNGNVAALAPDGIATLQAATGARVEVNLFHRTDQRIALITQRLEAAGCNDVLGADPDARIPGLEHERAKTCKQGIHGSDVVLVPLEDGDRCQALVEMGKTVVTIDLNPLSRTAQTATITIVDELTRALEGLAQQARTLAEAPSSQARQVIDRYSNDQTVADMLAWLNQRLAKLASDP